ncbi:MAG: nucleotide exchange factor GrpE [Anaerolineae bacterium]|nr:nucleotide exchange factor GrpE [Anaerolineae bacterium]
MSNDETIKTDEAAVEEAPPTDENAVSEEQVAQDAASDADKLLAKAQEEAKQYLESWQRERADFANYKKRAERELRESRDQARISTLMTLLPVIDDFELAMSNLPEDVKGQSWVEGIAAIQRKFLKILDDHSISVVDPVGEAFDPNLHEAIAVMPSDDVESGHVTETLQKGYVWGDRVLRPAMVRVAE